MALNNGPLLSKQEINIKRVLAKCEEYIQNDSHLDKKFHWRIKSYLSFIDEELVKIRDSNSENNESLFDEDSLRLYFSRIWKLRDKIKEAENIVNASNKKEKDNQKDIDILAKLQISATNQVHNSNNHNSGSNNLDDTSKDPLISNKSKRLQLLETTPAYKKALKLQHMKNLENQNINDQQTQDKLSQNLLSKTLQMKSMSNAVKNHVNSDLNTIDQIDNEVMENTLKLQQEVNKLNELNKKTGFCSTIFLMLMVFVSFCLMVVFIRLHSKLPNFYTRGRNLPVVEPSATSTIMTGGHREL